MLPRRRASDLQFRSGLFILLASDLVENHESNEEDSESTCEKSPALECDYDCIRHIARSLSAEIRDELGKEETSCEYGCDLSGNICTKRERKQVILLVCLDTDFLDNT